MIRLGYGNKTKKVTSIFLGVDNKAVLVYLDGIKPGLITQDNMFIPWSTLVKNGIVTTLSYSTEISKFNYTDGSFELILPTYTKSIRANAFLDSPITGIKINANLTTINEYAFKNCVNLEKVEFEEGSKLTHVYASAFSGCTALSIELPDSVSVISTNSFYEVLNVIYNGSKLSTTAKWRAKYRNYYFEDRLLYASYTKLSLYKASVLYEGEVKLPYSIQYIQSGCFANCDKITSINIPSRVEYIYTDIFNGCYNLESITVDSSNSKYKSIDDCNIIVYNTKNVIAGCKTSTIPEEKNITTIESSSFRNVGLTSIVIPEGVTTILSNAFADNPDLESVTLPSTLNNINTYAFKNCTSLNIVVPDTVTYIASDAFTNVAHVEYHGTSSGSPWGALSVN